ncbi:hypothetical protein [Flammeovirga sp. EKP202]|uniref:hypothetical protein n=1 Tax=Flammeovirga sp. EKP202 TaxID=2770592 RepID=UPI00165FEF08|nr:hypothetical protein [Flammeovirga sp. EKP202]MBD0402546.1 hypothetical protein [Flammeovirga sp. EKP202]
MLKIRQILLSFTLLMTACQTSSIDSKAIEQEILSLETIEKRERYLLKVLEDDQKVRDAATFHKIVSTYGTDSPEYQELGEKILNVDKVNRYKIDFYIRQYGFPAPDAFSSMARKSPFFVYQHITDIEERNEKLPTLLVAYQEGHLDIDLLNVFLGRTYYLKFNKNLVMENPYTPEQELEQLVNALGLTNKLL